MSGGGKTVTYGATDRRQGLQRDDGRRRRSTRRVAPAKNRTARTSSSDDGPAAARHPRQGRRAPTPTSRTSGCPGMLHARLVRPRGQGAYGTALSSDALGRRELDQAHPGVQVARKGQFPRRRRAARVRRDPGGGSAQGRVGHDTADPAGQRQHVEADARPGQPARKTANTATRRPATSTRPQAAATVLTQSYAVRLQEAQPDRPVPAASPRSPRTSALVLTNTQGTLPPADEHGQRCSACREKQIRIQYVEGASAFGHCRVGRRRRWRQRSLRSCSAARRCAFSSCAGTTTAGTTTARAQLMDISAGIDANGKIVALRQRAVGIRGDERRGETTTEIAGAGPLHEPRAPPTRPTPGRPQYNIANRRGIGKSVPVLNGGYLKTAPLRAPSSPNNFPAEQMIDELAYAAKMDPIAVPAPEHRARTRTTEALQSRREVVANWKPKVAASNLPNGNIVHGRGMALANPVAASWPTSRSTSRPARSGSCTCTGVAGRRPLRSAPASSRTR